MANAVLTTKRSSMPKALTITGMAVAGLLFLVFALDAILGFPFRQASLTMDIGFMIASVLLGYASWNSYKDLK